MVEDELLTLIGLLLRGVEYTLYVAGSCFMTAFTLGLGITALRRLTHRNVGRVLSLFVFVVRSIPVLVLLFLIYFGLPSVGISPSPLLAMNLSLGVIGAAYLSEVFRGALDSVDENEIAAARAMGFTPLQIITSIEFPQMLRFSVPGMTNELTAIIKSTPFAYTVGIPEIFGQAKALTASTLLGVNIYLIVGLLYFCIYKVFVLIIGRIGSPHRSQ
ncbi:amino acid ABC transporter permease [Pseudomonas matsuisoli]|uniref:Polar amino acid ABC transporter ATP-binding protein n=1 Tax=Pseudomonas matsuisoli TaxID=1515666 RepID=A0A917PUU3_9PSED|nr:amino acid ABC transporter permease [Pseudomonas matsuisoli]GGJ93624.1 polar amino acid ABC transporter ATP-binding protein [Pseudomonas matsuisoli]